MLVRATSSAGSTCQRPNRAEDTTVATPAPRSCSSIPQSTERNATSSNTTVPSGIVTRLISTADRIGIR